MKKSNFNYLGHLNLRFFNVVQFFCLIFLRLSSFLGQFNIPCRYFQSQRFNLGSHDIVFFQEFFPFLAVQFRSVTYIPLNFSAASRCTRVPLNRTKAMQVDVFTFVQTGMSTNANSPNFSCGVCFGHVFADNRFENSRRDFPVSSKRDVQNQQIVVMGHCLNLDFCFLSYTLVLFFSFVLFLLVLLLFLNMCLNL